ncbi:MAG: hypothetical protein RLZZ621_1654 [Gemmatimonadota bacterium]|jgi:nitrite reductase/ring-hydroxylating ferredoxin subunit
MDACTNCQSRRDFLATSTLGAVAAFLAACSSDESTTEPGPSGTVPTLTGTTTVRLADYPALANVGGIISITATSSPIAIVRSASDRYRAFSLVCPHAGGTVAIQGTGFRCPVHGATFSNTGAWTGGEKASALREFTATLNAAAGTLTITS